MDASARIKKMMDERGWTEYRLAKNSGLSESTLANIFNRKSQPSLPTVKAICDAFGITMSQFFAEYEMVELSPALKEVFNLWTPLTPEQKNVVLQVMKAMSQNK